MLVLSPSNFHSGVAGKRKSKAPEISAPQIVDGVLGPAIKRSVVKPRIDKLTPGCRKSTGNQEDENGRSKGAFLIQFFGLSFIAAGNGFINARDEDPRDRKNKQGFVHVELDAIANEGAVFDFTESANGPAAKPGIEFGDNHRQEDKDGEGKNFFKNGFGLAPGKTLETHLMMEEGGNKAKEARENIGSQRGNPNPDGITANSKGNRADRCTEDLGQDMSTLIDNEMRFEEEMPRKEGKNESHTLGKAKDEDVVRHELVLDRVVAGHNDARLEKRIDNQGTDDFSKANGPKDH